MRTKNVKLKRLVIVSLLYLTGSQLIAQTIGGPGWVYDSNGKVNSFYEGKQKKWATAGVVGGIRNPAARSRNVLASDNTEKIQQKINALSTAGGGVLKFPALTFNITKTLNVKKNVVLQGASNGTTTLKDKLSTNNSKTNGVVIKFENLKSGHRVGGIRNMTLQGPFSGNPIINKWTTAKPNANNIMVNFLRSTNLFLDNVKIINSGGSPISTFNSDGSGHYTFRNCVISGAWNKGGGGQGYFNIGSGYCLVYKCKIEKIRHFAIQTKGAKYNVVYDNIINQDVNFHNDDSGNNLIEKNKITIGSAIAGSANNQQRFVVMGPWSSQHTDSRTDNFVYNNIVSEFGRSNPRCNNSRYVYKGARGQEPGRDPGNNPFSTRENVGGGKRFYSVKNNTKTTDAESIANEIFSSENNAFSVYPNPVVSGDILNVMVPNTVIKPNIII
ncbi:right-handed parallel beta-helix repeat-containing protein [Aquimarina algiphila]|uniref:right-handed parallel beta-helix repeat-containing protein n=1 Tax=Aquimarina algiphila TaxID=2047982 RepID=UPI00232E7CBA|nr:right-handed parallel beta-helix repeat-containing protein [Aquimarina algiphila]